MGHISLFNSVTLNRFFLGSRFGFDYTISLDCVWLGSFIKVVCLISWLVSLHSRRILLIYSSLR